MRVVAATRELDASFVQRPPPHVSRSLLLDVFRDGKVGQDGAWIHKGCFGCHIQRGTWFGMRFVFSGRVNMVQYVASGLLVSRDVLGH